jgi:hypothetical protein
LKKPISKRGRNKKKKKKKNKEKERESGFFILYSSFPFFLRLTNMVTVKK